MIATLVIDMQVDCFSPPRLTECRQTLVSNTNALVQASRRIGLPVIWIKQVYAADLSDAPRDVRRLSERLLIEGTPGAALLPELDVRPTDLTVTKKRSSAFYRTELEVYLSRIQCKTLIVAGVNLHTCLRDTIVDAHQRDYEVWLASDCVNSNDEQHHWVTYRYLRNRLATTLTNAQLDAEFRSFDTRAPEPSQADNIVDDALTKRPPVE